MNRKLVIVCIITLLAAGLSAFDGNRQGFILGFGVGLSHTAWMQSAEYYGGTEESPTETVFGYATDFKIGFGVNPSTELYYSSKVAWFSMENMYNDTVTIADGVGIVGLSYFFNSSSPLKGWEPSFFISGGFGYSGWTAQEEGAKSWTGTGFSIGGGYEFIKHYRFEANLFINNPSTTIEGIDFTTNSTALLFTLNGLAY